ncbi:MAG: alkaline phosphatase family protein [Bacteriovoracia bacterium]
MKLIPIFVAASLILSLGASADPDRVPLKPDFFAKKPKLLLVLVVDQMRADYLTRFRKRFLPARRGAEVGGFEYLLSQGAYFPYANYEVLHTVTGVGHATILSGAYPYRSGIPENNWFDEQGRKTECVDDDAYRQVGIDEPEKVPGVSPRHFNGTTVGDELKNAGYASRVVGIGLKERSGVLLGGKRANLVLWLDDSYRWVSSRYYLPDGKLPLWVQKFNDDMRKHMGQEYVWKKPAKRSGLTEEHAPPGVVPTGSRADQRLPITMKLGSPESTAAPHGLHLTTALAEAAIDAFRLGGTPDTDLLAVSFSSFDYIGHHYGPNSLLVEEMTIELDRALAQLFNRLRQKIPGGLANVEIVLTSDHGVSPHPEWARTWKLDSGRINEANLTKMLNEKLAAKYGSDAKPWVFALYDFNVYLNRARIREEKADETAMENDVKRWLLEDPGIAQVFTKGEWAAGKLGSGQAAEDFRRTYYPGRSGDVVAVPRPFHMMERLPTTHVSSYSYDRTVPLVLVGRRYRPGIYPNAVNIVDIAPTLTFGLGLIPPALSEGRILSEAFLR